MDNVVAVPKSVKDSFISFVRGFSMVTIVWHHYMKKVVLSKWLYTAFFFGGSGIHAFIFVSGYGLGLSRSTDWVTFYEKRFKKVLIPYYIGITLIFLLNLLLPVYTDGWQAYLSHLLLYKMFVETYNISFGGHFWFISTIVQVYLLFPFISWFIGRVKPVNAVLVGVAISISWSVLVSMIGKQHERIWTCCALQYVWEFILGITIARARLLPVLLRQSWLLYSLTFIAGVAGTYLMVQYAGQVGRQFNDYFAFVGYLSGCVLLFKLSQYQLWIERFVLWIEPFSYALFITHIFVLDAYNRLAGRDYLTGLDLPLLIPITLLVALAFHQATNNVLSTPKVTAQPVMH